MKSSEEKVFIGYFLFELNWSEIYWLKDFDLILFMSSVKKFNINAFVLMGKILPVFFKKLWPLLLSIFSMDYKPIDYHLSLGAFYEVAFQYWVD